MDSAYIFNESVATRTGSPIHIAQREGVSYHKLEDRFAVASGRVNTTVSPNRFLADMALQAVENTAEAARRVNSGSTLVAAFLSRSKQLYSMNMGDSRNWVITCDRDDFTVRLRRMTTDHDLDNPRIRAQVVNNGGTVREDNGHYSIGVRPDGRGGFETWGENGAGCGDLDTPGLVRKPQVYLPVNIAALQAEGVQGQHVIILTAMDGLNPIQYGFAQVLSDAIRKGGPEINVAALAVAHAWKSWDAHYEDVRRANEETLKKNPKARVSDPHIDDMTAMSYLVPRGEMPKDILLSGGDGHGYRYDHDQSPPVLTGTGHVAAEAVVGTVGRYMKKLMTPAQEPAGDIAGTSDHVPIVRVSRYPRSGI